MLSLLVLSVILSACGARGGGGNECKPAGQAEVCLSKGSNPEVTATELEPGSPVIALESRKEGAPPPEAIVPVNVGPDGSFPPEGASLRFAGGGSEALTVLITVTPRGGKPVTVTFQRS